MPINDKLKGKKYIAGYLCVHYINNRVFDHRFTFRSLLVSSSLLFQFSLPFLNILFVYIRLFHRRQPSSPWALDPAGTASHRPRGIFVRTVLWDWKQNTAERKQVFWETPVDFKWSWLCSAPGGPVRFSHTHSIYPILHSSSCFVNFPQVPTHAGLVLAFHKQAVALKSLEETLKIGLKWQNYLFL